MIFDKLYKNENDVLDLIDRTFENNSGYLLTYFNQHCFNIFNSNDEYRNLLDNSFEVLLDGVGIYLTLKIFDYKNVQRFNATDINKKIFNRFSAKQIPLFLIGGKFSKEFVLERASEKKINVVGYQNGYFSFGDELQMEKDILLLVDQIKRTSAEVVVIAIGVPKQEILAHKLVSLVEVDLILCVGGFLEFYFESKKRAPKILRDLGIEWAYRLFKEPTRLWKRYLVGIPIFLYNVFKEYLKFKK